MRMKHNETGRSMVEMLGVLAVVGVLSIGGVAGYRYAVDKMNANEIINELKKRAITASQQRVLGQGINLSEYGAILGKYEVTPANGYPQDPAFFGLEIKAVPQKVCQHIVDSEWAMPAEMKISNLIIDQDTECPNEFNDIIFAFNNTLSNDTELGNEGETTESTVTEIDTATVTMTETDTATGTPKEAESGPCAGHGELADIYGGTCLCDAGWSGSWPSYCDENIDRCNGHGLWNGCGCLCDAGWSGGELGYNGDSCTQNIDVCNKNGRFNIYSGSKSCICDPGAGNDCSLEGITTETTTATQTQTDTSTDTSTSSNPEESVSRICGEQQIQDKYGNCYDCPYGKGGSLSGVIVEDPSECYRCEGWYAQYNSCYKCPSEQIDDPKSSSVPSSLEDSIEKVCQACGLGVNWNMADGSGTSWVNCSLTSEDVGTKPETVTTETQTQTETTTTTATETASGGPQICGTNGNCYNCSDYDAGNYGIEVNNQSDCSVCDETGHQWVAVYFANASRLACRACKDPYFSDIEDHIEESCDKCGFGVDWSVAHGSYDNHLWYSCAPTSEDIGTKPNS